MTGRLLIAACVLLCALSPFAGGGDAVGRATPGPLAVGDTTAEGTEEGAAQKPETVSPVTIKIEDMEFCTGIDSWAPVGAGKIFRSTVGKVYCFTRVIGADEPTEIVHVWYFNDEEKARVTLAVRSKNWRTWSSKRLLEYWTGKWRVDVQTADGKLLRSSEFLVESEPEAGASKE